MERLAELINKLKEQFEQNADAGKLLGITMLIERELTKPQPAKINASQSSKVSVQMPASRNGFHPQPDANEPENLFNSATNPVAESSPVVIAAPKEIAKPREEIYEASAPAPKPVVTEVKEVVQPIAQAPQPVPPVPQPAERKQTIQEFSFNPLIEIPTLAQQQSIQEINEMIGIRDASLNDKLKDNKVEIGEILKDYPIRDLKKAIGVNDRFVFINELFRGDEVMYERSLKTINSFRIFAEAEYWIERELKVKLGWEEHKDTTRHFYQLVRRRFS
jgi:hypothetical protein